MRFRGPDMSDVAATAGKGMVEASAQQAIKRVPANRA